MVGQLDSGGSSGDGMGDVGNNDPLGPITNAVDLTDPKVWLAILAVAYLILRNR